MVKIASFLPFSITIHIQPNNALLSLESFQLYLSLLYTTYITYASFILLCIVKYLSYKCVLYSDKMFKKDYYIKHFLI